MCLYPNERAKIKWGLKLCAGAVSHATLRLQAAKREIIGVESIF